MRKLLAFGAALLTAGCLDAPDDTTRFRAMAETHPLLTTKAFTVNRSLSAVNASIAKGAEKCFQRVTANTVYGGSTGYGGRASAQVVMKYQYTFRKTSTGAELGLHQRQVNANFLTPDKEGGYVYVADTRASGGGTKVTLYTGKLGYKEIDSAIYGWASGQHLYCPQM